MMKKNNKKNKINLEEKIVKLISSENFKPFLGWFLIFLSFLFILSILSPKGLITYKLYLFLKKFLGWTFYFLPFFLLFSSFFLFKKFSWLQIFKKFLGLTFIFFFLNFYIEYFFGESGFLGKILYFSSYVFGSLGSFVFYLFLSIFGLWLFLEEKFFLFFKYLFFNAKKELEKNLQREKIEEPLKGIKQEIKIETKTKYKKAERQTTSLPLRKVIQKSKWELPPLELLKQGKEEVITPDVNKTSEIIIKTLESFEIKTEIVDVEIGPAVTRFSLKPGEGIKLSKILSLQNDIALALGVPNLILETPIPGKAVIGIEVPNIKSAVVRLGNVLNHSDFLNSDNLLLFPLGRKINGGPYFADLVEMPHLLIAGTTGSGKSIFIHNMLISFLMKNTPETLNFILVDPKRVELINYSPIPHLLFDTITDIKKTVAVFNWLVNEMEERYRILEASGSRDIDSYNKKQIQKKEKIIPRIVLVIDEMADLMITYGSSIETIVIRLTQMARATGIHLVLATQRPSVDVVTGLIKANIPNRICFKVASQVDSRTVLDIGGAEKLIGAGDALFISTNLHRPLRVKAPFVTEEEINKVVRFWVNQLEKVPEEEVRKISLEEIEKTYLPTIGDEAEDKALLKEAIKIVVNSGKASTSLLQRKLKIGYARAARLLDLMEEKGIVGPQEGSKPRRVLISPEEIEEIFKEES